MPRTTIGQRWRVVALREAGMSSRAISARLGIPKSTVCDIFNRHTQRPGDVTDRHRSGRPRKTTPREDRRLGRIALRKRFCTSMELRRRWNLGIPISRSLVSRRLKQLNIRSRRPVRKPELTQRHKQVFFFLLKIKSKVSAEQDVILSRLYFRHGLHGAGVSSGSDFHNGDEFIGVMSAHSA